MNITAAQHKALESGEIDLTGKDRYQFTEVDFSDIKGTIEAIAAKYVDLITDNINARDMSSSGYLADNITPTEIEIDGDIMRVSIKAPEYASYVDEGVSGWAKDRGSRFKFKTRGVDPNGAHVRSMKEYIAREGSMARNIKRAVSSREQKQMKMRDAKTSAAMTAAYMVKRFGIKPTRFWRDATDDIVAYIENELGIAVKIDIINSLTT